MWLGHKHGETNNRISQLLLGFGGYNRQYLPRFGLDDSLNCPGCIGMVEDPENVLF